MRPSARQRSIAPASLASAGKPALGKIVVAGAGLEKPGHKRRKDNREATAEQHRQACHHTVGEPAFVLLHTAVRPAEARGMELDELDLDRARWLIPAERMKGGGEDDVPLVPEVMSLLRVIREIQIHDRYVFPNVTNTGPASDCGSADVLSGDGHCAGYPGPHACATWMSCLLSRLGRCQRL